MPNRKPIVDQIRGNLVALISLVIALTSLAYNTWRNEATELNRNVRHAGFELMMQAAELRELTYLLHYDPDSVDAHAARSGWVIVITIDELAQILAAPMPASATRLRETWGKHAPTIRSAQSIAAVDEALDVFVGETLSMLKSLD